jgi:hypothetical protein
MPQKFKLAYGISQDLFLELTEYVTRQVLSIAWMVSKEIGLSIISPLHEWQDDKHLGLVDIWS